MYITYSKRHPHHLAEPTCLSEITKGARGVSADTALRLERYFGSAAQGWLNLQSAYDLRLAEMSAGKSIAEAVKPLALAT